MNSIYKSCTNNKHYECHNHICDHCKCNPCKCDYDKRKSCIQHPTLTETTLACGTGTGANIPIPTNNGTFSPITLASVSIDTSCLKKPTVKIDFDSIINYSASMTVADDAAISNPFTVTFQLSKTCNDGSKIGLGNWYYSTAFLLPAVNTTDSFSFTHCECSSCSGCCIYTIEIVQASASVLTNVTDLVENAQIVSSSISALASSC
ncbi:DUF4489 domain-containing protein [Clostridium cochlearium]|uniref:DUF4489 domain-containing protein n=1 Tax=Clostridium cochlearium TaxID=1494 RepID=UPI001C0EB00C|nr:DUF4489 domain-containing protein [Clostridium cochlearium]MBU5270547.1 DUF4489 domain-containing protein [Clostridium cochlearium]